MVPMVQISNERRIMCPSVKNFFKVAIGLTSATILLIAPQAQAATSETIKPDAFLLAQSAEPQQSHVAPSAQEEEKLKQEKVREQKMQLEKQAPKTRAIQPPPPPPGTKKLGGGIIRNKEAPEGQ
jgi:hypothetical protein